MKIWFSDLRFSANVTHSAWLIQQVSYNKPIQHVELPEWVPVLWLCGEGGAKAFLREKPAMPKSPEGIFHPQPVCQRLPREKGNTSGLKGCISFYLSVTEPWGRQHYGHLREAHSTTSASKKVAGGNMSNPSKTPEGQWPDRCLQKRILPSLQINKWTWITGCHL